MAGNAHGKPLAQGKQRGPTAVPAGTALQMATFLGAKGTSFGTSGAAAAGVEADLILVDTHGLHWQPASDLTGRVVYAGEQDVSLVIVDGRILYEDGSLLTIDEEKVSYEVGKRSASRSSVFYLTNMPRM